MSSVDDLIRERDAALMRADALEVELRAARADLHFTDIKPHAECPRCRSEAALAWKDHPSQQRWRAGFEGGIAVGMSLGALMAFVIYWAMGRH